MTYLCAAVAQKHWNVFLDMYKGTTHKLWRQHRGLASNFILPGATEQFWNVCLDSDLSSLTGIFKSKEPNPKKSTFSRWSVTCFLSPVQYALSAIYSASAAMTLGLCLSPFLP